MSPPERPAWFYHRVDDIRCLGIYDADEGQYLNCGVVDELAALADQRLVDLASVRTGATPMTSPPAFDVPVARPSKILCIGKNYTAHAAELNSTVPTEPIFFTKFADTLLPHSKPIVVPHWVDSRIDHEVELAVILGFDDPSSRGRKYITRDEAMDLVAGYTILNDVTARQIQSDDRNKKFPWLRSKSFDTFCPMGPWVIPASELPEVGNLEIQLWVNGELRQDSTTSLLVYDIPHVIAYLSQHTTLRPGDIIATGTPAGVGPLSDGDIVTCRVQHIGTLSNPVVRETKPS